MDDWQRTRMQNFRCFLRGPSDAYNSNFYNRDYNCTSQNFYRGSRLGCLNSGYGAAILVFLYQTLWHTPIECMWDMKKSRFLTSIWLHHVLSMVWPPSVVHTAVLDRGKLVTLIAGKHHRLLFAWDRWWSVYDEKPQCYIKDNRTEFNCMQWEIWSHSN